MSLKVPTTMLGFWLVALLGWWVFAFAPFFEGGPSPTWLTDAQNACFGTMENGLPDTYGWMVLLLAPGSFFVGLWITWYHDLIHDLKALTKTPQGRALIAVSVSAILVTATLVGIKIQKGIQISTFNYASGFGGDLPESYPQTQNKAPEFSLINQEGKTLTLTSFQGQPFLLTFAFAHCQTVCPMLVEQAKAAQKQLGTAITLPLVVITLDPHRDTPGSLPALAKKWTLPNGSHVLSGSVSEVEKTIKEYNIPTERDEKTGDVTHPAISYIINAQGEIAYTFNNAPPLWLAQAVRRLSGGISSHSSNQ